MTVPDQAPPSAPPAATAAAPEKSGFFSKPMQIALIVLATVFAGWPIASLVEEREGRQSGLVAELSHNWGSRQEVHAPLLVIPIEFGQEKPRQYLKIAASDFVTTTRLATERKQRGAFSASVYDAAVQMSGAFVVPSLKAAGLQEAAKGVLRWQDSFVLLETSSLAGLRDGDQFKWQGHASNWRPCRDVVLADEKCASNSVAVAVPQSTSAPESGTRIPFEMTLSLRGTASYRQILNGAQGAVSISSPWPSPSFTGSVLPSASSVTGQGFEAQWQVRDFSSRQYALSPQITGTASFPFSPFIEVELIDKAPVYRMIDRVSKYNILLVALSFATYVLFEILSGIRIHPVQYALLGGALTLFGLLLVPFAESLGYNVGYACSASLVLVQASLYTAAVTRRLFPSALFAAMLAGLFSFLFVLLRMESYALLVGSLALFVVLSVVMALTQRIDWGGRRG